LIKLKNLGGPMKARSGLEISLPAMLLGAACLLSIPTLIVAVLWIFIGVVCLGHRELKQFPVDRVPRHWQHGARSWLLWCYHIAWWPWYMRADLSFVLERTRLILKRRRIFRKRDDR
jgi:hypothetical protein